MVDNSEEDDCVGMGGMGEETRLSDSEPLYDLTAIFLSFVSPYNNSNITDLTVTCRLISLRAPHHHLRKIKDLGYQFSRYNLVSSDDPEKKTSP